MKNLLFGCMAALFMASCGGSDQQADAKKDDQKPLVVSKNSEGFNQSFEALWSQYDALKQALVKEDGKAADVAARLLLQAADSLKMNELKADSLIIETAKGNVANLTGNAKGLLAETNIEKKRENFQMLSSDLYDLIRITKYDKKKFYQQFCPMAFDDKGAYWVNDSRDIINPYMGDKHPKYGNTMIQCGENKDSLNFAGN